MTAPRLEEDDLVITPAGEKARVLHCSQDGSCDLEYMEPLRRDNALLTLPVRLLRSWTRDKPLPRPVRIGADGKPV